MSTITAIATPNATGGISVIRISGEKAVEIADRVFRSISEKPVAQMKAYTCAYGYVFENGEAVDDVVGLQRLQLADREEVVVVVRVHEMGTISVIASQVANLPNTMLGEDARNWAFFANSTGSVASASEVAVMPMSM